MRIKGHTGFKTPYSTMLVCCGLAQQDLMLIWAKKKGLEKINPFFLAQMSIKSYIVRGRLLECFNS